MSGGITWIRSKVIANNKLLFIANMTARQCQCATHSAGTVDLDWEPGPEPEPRFWSQEPGLVTGQAPDTWYSVLSKTINTVNQSYHAMQKRYPEYYKVVRAQTERFRKSAIPSMIKLLNDCQRKKSETFKKLDTMPVNHACSSLYHCDNNKQ